MKQIYISSTYKDLVEYRAAVYKALRKMGHNVINNQTMKRLH